MSTYLTRFLEVKNKETGKWELVKRYKKFYKTKLDEALALPYGVDRSTRNHSNIP